MRFLACSDAAVQQWDGGSGWVVVVGFGVVKRKIRWRFQVGSDVVLMPCLCDGGGDGEWSGCAGGGRRGIIE